MKTFKRNINVAIAVVDLTLTIVWVICLPVFCENVVLVVLPAFVIIAFTLFWQFGILPDFNYTVAEIEEDRIGIKKDEDVHWFEKSSLHITRRTRRYLVLKDARGESAQLRYNKAFLTFLQGIEANNNS